MDYARFPTEEIGCLRGVVWVSQVVEGDGSGIDIVVMAAVDVVSVVILSAVGLGAILLFGVSKKEIGGVFVTRVVLRNGCTASGSLSRWSPSGGYVILSGDRIFHFEDCVSVVTEREGGVVVDEVQAARDFLAECRRKLRRGDEPIEVRPWE